MDAFVWTHRVHTLHRKVSVDGVTFACQFGVYTFCYRNSADLPVQAKKNKWAVPWLEHWFYYKLGSRAGEHYYSRPIITAL